MKDITYEHLAIVLETWDAARYANKEFDTKFGMVALEHLFKLQPRAKKVFGYDKGEEVGRAHANVHASAFAGLFDSVFQMLGPDTEFIEEILEQVGKKHKTMGVSPSFFPFMGQALMKALEEITGNDLTKAQQEAWESTYEAISEEIVKNILA